MSMNNDQLNDENLCACVEALVCALKYRDEHTQMHSQRVIGLSEEIGVACSLLETEISLLKISACFHDVGKIGIADKILLKTTAFSSEEWEVMKSHSEIGEKIVKKLLAGNGNGDVIAKAVRHHHEHFDGSGYPDQLSQDQIPLFSRIISVADSYDAMTDTRPYHKCKSHIQVMEVIVSEAGSKLDPYVVSKFELIIRDSKLRI